MKPSGSSKPRLYQRNSPGRSTRPTPDSALSGGKGTQIS